MKSVLPVFFRSLSTRFGRRQAGETLGESERRFRLLIENSSDILAVEGGHVDVAARKLGISRSSLYQKIKRFGISVSRI